MTLAEQEVLVEAVVSADRERDPRGGLRPCPAFYDLDEAGRRAAFEQALLQRAIEGALDPSGLTSTAKRVLQVIAGAGAR